MIWIDAQLSPSIAVWIKDELGLEAMALRELGLRDAEDEEIYLAARQANATVMTKDSDFVMLLERFGPPPNVLLLTCGNTSNDSLKKILKITLHDALDLFDQGDSLVEIG